MFDPFKRDKFNEFNNPYLNSMTAVEMRNLKLRDMGGRITGLGAIGLRETLQYTRDNHPNILIILDIKYASSVLKSAERLSRTAA